jgi:uncharacterized protein YlzI (FlbEa/FlbD family)
MIFLTKKDAERTRFLINYKLIERIEERGNTIIFLENGKTIHVDESAEEIQEKVVAFESRIFAEHLRKKDTNS